MGKSNVLVDPLTGVPAGLPTMVTATTIKQEAGYLAQMYNMESLKRLLVQVFLIFTGANSVSTVFKLCINMINVTTLGFVKVKFHYDRT